MLSGDERVAFGYVLLAAALASAGVVSFVVAHQFVYGATWLSFPLLALVTLAAGVRRGLRAGSADSPLVAVGTGLLYWVVVFPLCFVVFAVGLLLLAAAAFPPLDATLTGTSVAGYLGLNVVFAVLCFVVALTTALVYRRGRTALGGGGAY